MRLFFLRVEKNKIKFEAFKNFRIYAHFDFNFIKTTKIQKKGKYIYYRGRHQSSSETRAKRKLVKKVLKMVDDNYERTTIGLALCINIT